MKLKLDDMSPLITDHPGSAVLLRRLERADLADAALCLAAHALPPREAVWWACRCARHAVTAEGRLPADIAAGEAAEAWVRDPTSAHRARAYAAARRAQFQSAEALAGLAVFWSGAEATLSMPATAAAAQLSQTVENAVRMASFRGAPQGRPLRLHHFLESARDIDQGGAGHLPPANEA
ncbi:DUF6931 family protein [Acidisoma cladoniae]|uniref:DUF6931 family protein n=1 Tax=Acidisoma cladoniae TaxID=3040935 RepID=UPI00254A1D97|nr:hypothetical protein [Acidisoma sp. PAMC 29798]